MRARIFAVLSLALICLLVWLPSAGATTITLAQEDSGAGEEVITEQDETEQSEADDEEDGTGQSDTDAETGASSEEQAGEAVEEEGPPWTYQMARIGIALMLLIGIALGALYYRMIASRQRAA